MPTRKIEDSAPTGPARGCMAPDHWPSTNVVRTPGLYEHECSVCHRSFSFRIHPRARLG